MSANETELIADATAEYQSFVTKKLSVVTRQGIAGDLTGYALKPHQNDLTAWALRRACAAIFADTGLGKSRMQVAWSDVVCKSRKGAEIMILAPLAVAGQTVEEAANVGVEVNYCREDSDVRPGINITNYDRIHKFDCSRFYGVVLDESSIIKHHSAKTLQTLLDAFRDTPFKLCATATPAPNDWTELGNHAEFLGVRSRAEMLAEFFVHDGGDTQTWRLKGHARQAFWKWVASWGAMIRSPADLGHDASEYELPPLHVHQHTVELEHNEAHGLFAMEAQTLSERRDARKASLVERVRACAAVVYEGWYKSGESNQKGEFNGMEKGICGSQKGESRCGPGVQGQEECSIDQRQSGESAIHGNVLQGESGEIQADSGATGKVQRKSEAEVQRVCRVQRGGESGGKGLARWESSKAEVSAPKAVRPDAARIQCSDGVAIGGLCNLRSHGHVNAELLPSSGSLPLVGEGARDSVHGLQYGAGKVQGRHGASYLSSFVPQEPWLIWCELNSEQDALERAFGDLAFSVRGSDTADEKEAMIRSWLSQERPVMISKPSIMGFGLNFQHCRNMAFVGVTDSFESYYQAVRRCWRFGQKRDTHVHVFASNLEGAVVANLKRKEREAQAMADAMSAETLAAVRSEVFGFTKETNIYQPARQIVVPAFLAKEAA